METVTLPSRLRQHYDFEASLAGADNTRTIYELQSTIPRSEEPRPQESLVDAQDAQEDAQTEFDVDFTYDHFVGKNKQVFNQFQAIRGLEFNRNVTPGETEDLGLLRRMRFQNSEPMTQRLVG